MLLPLFIAVLFEFSFDLFNFSFESLDVCCIVCIALLLVGNICIHLVFALLRHQRLPHSIGNGRLVESLVGCNCHLYFISYSNQQESSLGTLDCDLSDQFVEALREKLFSYWTNSSLPCHL